MEENEIIKNESATEIQPKKKNKMIILIIGIAILVIVSAIICIILFGKKGGKEKKYAQIAIEALSQDLNDTIGAKAVFQKVYVKVNGKPVDYTQESLSEYCYYDIVARVYINFFNDGGSSVSPMTCCVFVDKHNTANIMYYFDDETIRYMYRNSGGNSEYAAYLPAYMVGLYHNVYDAYFPKEAELPEWTEIPVKSGQKNLSIKEILE